MIKVFKRIKPVDAFLNASAAIISILGVYTYPFADDSFVQVLLWPHAKAVEFFYNISLNFVSGAGYTEPGGLFVISKACMGANFIAMLFCMLVCTFSHRFEGKQKLIWFGVSFTASAAIGVLVSILRIIGSIPFISHDKFSVVHTWTGIAFYFIALLSVYLIVKRILGGKRHETNI